MSLFFWPYINPMSNIHKILILILYGWFKKVRDFVTNPGGVRHFAQNSRGKTDFERHLTHKLVLNKFSKSLKKSCNTYKDFIPYSFISFFSVPEIMHNNSRGSQILHKNSGGHICCQSEKKN